MVGWSGCKDRVASISGVGIARKGGEVDDKVLHRLKHGRRGVGGWKAIVPKAIEKRGSRKRNGRKVLRVEFGES